ncbi:MAG: carboxypeptidase regulatory-like domain-containing protein [Gemmatimonadaceae bacterium]
MRRTLLCMLALSVACKSEKRGPDGDAASSGGAPGKAANGPTGDGSVTGTIHFAGTPAANQPIDMSEEETCQAKYAGGPAPADSVYVVNNGGLGNTFVYVKSGLPAGATYAPPATPVVIDQRGCLYHPRIFGMQVGQKLEIKNSDPVLHNIKAVPSTNRGFNISQPSAGMTTTRTFSKPEVMVPLQCNVHGWMHADVGVLPHPFFATSTSDGHYTIKGLPPGTYVIEAWHEKLGPQTATVTVGAGEAKTVDFNYGTKA